MHGTIGEHENSALAGAVLGTVLQRQRNTSLISCWSALNAATKAEQNSRRLEGKSKDLRSRHQPKLEACKLSEADAEYWSSVGANLDKQQSHEQLQRLDLTFMFGITKQMLQTDQKPSCYEDFVQTRLRHPRKVIICKIGEFYESIGLDAVLLIQYCNLNPMGNRIIPHAGFPCSNLDAMMKLLVVDHGISVVILEEHRSLSNPKSGRRFERSIGGILTPARPYYVYGQIDAKCDITQNLDTTRPVLGVASSVSGYKIIEVNIDLMKYTVHEGLTEDSVNARLYNGGLAPPLYIYQAQQSGPYQLTEASAEREWEIRIGQLFRNQVWHLYGNYDSWKMVGAIHRYQAHDPVEGLLEVVKREVELPPDTKFEKIVPGRQSRPKSLFYCTAGQLGLHQVRGIPSLLDALLPSNASKRERFYIRKLLLHPPPPEVAASICKANQMLSTLQVPLPQWTLMDCSHVARFIKAQECPVDFFRDLKAVLLSVEAALCNSELRPIAEEILHAVRLETGLSFHASHLEHNCSQVVGKIASIILDSEQPVEHNNQNALSSLDPMASFLAQNEGFRGKVKESLLAAELREVGEHMAHAVFHKISGHDDADITMQVAEAWSAVEEAFEAAYRPLVIAGDLSKSQPRPLHDSVNNAIWIKIIKGSKAFSTLEKLRKSGEVQYIVPLDRNGRSAKLKDVWSTEELVKSLAEYKVACEKAHLAVQNLLRHLASQLEEWMNDLVGATVFSLVASALEAHVQEAVRKGWVLPHQQSRSVSKNEALPISVDGMWPYWLDGRHLSTVRNSLSFGSMTILTGPNMAGKSTLMRSLCAVSLLAACGLHAPVASASVPFIDAFMLRSFSADSPVSGQSSFAIEMSEVKHVIQNVSRNSLVLVDELGKGTEPQDGTYIAAAFVEYLAGISCKCMFATHLHGILDIPGLQLPGVAYMCMETVEAVSSALDSGVNANRDGDKLSHTATGMGEHTPTWRVIPGINRHSLAFVVMAQYCGPDHPVVKRAIQLQEESTKHGKDSITPETEGRAGPASASSQLVEAEESLQDLQSLQEPVSPSNPVVRIEDAGKILADTAVDVFGRLSSECDGGASSGRGPSSHPVVVRKGERPPPSVGGRSCVYIALRPDGYFYVGETDDLRGRLATHRNRDSGRVRGGPSTEAVYVEVPPDLQGKSAAKDLEACVINSMSSKFPLLSVADSKRKFGPRHSF